MSALSVRGERNALHRLESWDDLRPESMRRLFMAALESFAEKGYHGTTTRDIAARAGLSPAAIYMHYKSKAELLHIMIRVSHEELLKRMIAAFEDHAGSVDRVKALVSVHAAFHAQRQTAARVANEELPALPRRHRAEILELRRQIEDLMENAIRAGIDDRKFQVQDLRTTTFAILSMGIGVSRWFKSDGRLSPEELGELYADLIAKMLSSNGHAQTDPPTKRSSRKTPGRGTGPGQEKSLGGSSGGRRTP